MCPISTLFYVSSSYVSLFFPIRIIRANSANSLVKCLFKQNKLNQMGNSINISAGD